MAFEYLSISGGTILNSGWTENGGIKKTTFQGSCGEAFVGEQRLVPARSPNLANINATVNLAHPPYNSIKVCNQLPYPKSLAVLISLSFHFKDLLVSTATCIRGATAFSQNCPDDNKKGFVFNNEFSSGWSNLDQTRVLVFHSWIAEFATVGSISGDRLMFQQPLSHAPVGKALIVNN